MKRIEFKGLEVDIYTETMDNGLEVYVIPNKEVVSNTAFFSTKYGNRINEFIPIGETEFKKYPAGIAHFLEHKVFEQADGIDPFQFFNAHGADANAYTNKNITAYHFTGVDHFGANLNYLLDFVQNIYLTDENVLKEKGIIVEEAKTELDNLGRLMYSSISEMAYVNDPRKFKVIGEIDEINSITKEQLLECYNTFYHPTNMTLVVSGNVEVDEVFKIVRENQNNKEFSKAFFPEIKKVNEPAYLAHKEIIKKGNTGIPYLGYIIKVNLQNMECDFFTKDTLFDALFYQLFSGSTGFSEELRKKRIINMGLNSSYELADDYCIISICSKTVKINEYFDAIKNHFENIVPDKETFERFKKVRVGDFIAMTDSPYRMSGYISSNLYYTNKLGEDDFMRLKALTFEEYEKFVNGLDFSETGKIIIEPKK